MNERNVAGRWQSSMVDPKWEPPTYTGELAGRVVVGSLLGAVAFVLVGALVIGFLVVMTTAASGSTDELMAIALIGLFVLIAGIFMAISIALPTSLVSYALVVLVARTMFRQAPLLVVAGVSGGLTGFLSILWLLIWGRGGDLELVAMWGPFIATVFGQMGVVWMCLPVTYRTLREVDIPGAMPPVPGARKPPFRLRFEIRQLLIATAWVAALLGVLKATSLLGPWFAAIIAGWFVYQAVTLAIVIVVVKKVRGYE
ncbi:hypothetical protein [Aeoliella mucimassa]|uniref:Uncharacterized protein n=1 Tax=Aeoliella mucimassa TaxID=2527972 RepID=A0A518AU99_9BACT|nr:hypothetical protein [Aeoliella mucimassa]QDU58293.1 hypothetical protein Pan181_45260 [Aeoliella mucimassa]